LFKYPIFAVIRSPFPWLLNWELRFIGSNKIGKGTIFEECYIHSHINYGKNCYVGTFSHITNHLVDGVYGSENLTLFGAESGDSCIFNALIGGLPGLEVGDNSTLLPMCSTIKFDKLGENGIYAGFPAKKLDKKKIDQILGGEYPGE
jgi:NDP-sugar pyrophosphorylase family protein